MMNFPARYSHIEAFVFVVSIAITILPISSKFEKYSFFSLATLAKVKRRFIRFFTNPYKGTIIVVMIELLFIN